MSPPRPTAVTVIAILHLIFGGLGLLCSLFGLLMQSVSDPTRFMAMAAPPPGAAKGFDPQEMVKQIQERMPSYIYTVGMAHEAVGVVLSILLIIAGIGLLQMRPWARILSILYGFTNVVIKIAYAVYTFILVLPAQREVNQIVFQQIRGQAKTRQEQAMLEAIMNMADMGAVIGSLVVPIVTMAYPIVVLVIMFLKSTRQAFAGEVLPVGEDEYDRR
jgi:hypothetical protein